MRFALPRGGAGCQGEDGDDRSTMLKRHEDTSSVVQRGMTLTSALLYVGSSLPLVGSLCEAAQSCLGSAGEFGAKAEDVTIAARRVCDVLDVVYLMAQNTERLEEKALVEPKMRRLVELLGEFNQAMRKFGKKGWMKRAWTMRGHVDSLGRLDKAIVAQLDVFRDVYRLARDKDMIQRTYNIEASINQLVAERVRQTGEPEGTVVAVLSNDPVAIASVALDAHVPPAELENELSEFRLEVREGLEGLDAKMQQLLEGKRGDSQEIAAVLDAVNAAAARDAKLLAAVESFDSSIRRVSQTLEKKSKEDFNRQTKEAQLALFEIKLDSVKAEPIARGAQGEVCMGEYQGEIVVLKKISLLGVSAPTRNNIIKDFSTELGIMMRLRSPRVVQFFGVMTTNPAYLGLVTEYCDGGSLRAALDEKSDKVTVDLQHVWGFDIAAGMAFLYSQGVEHRDLKSGNVLLTRDGRCKVTDFGLSKCEELKTAATTRFGCMGTPAFMAPELLDRNVFSEKSDVYSFAIVLWEIWHGGVPWRGLQPMQIMRKVVDKGERPPVPAGMPSKLRELMVRAWSGDPGGRPPFQEIVSEVRIVRVAPLAPAPARSGFASWFGAAPPTAQDVELLATGASVVAGGAAIVVDEDDEDEQRRRADAKAAEEMRQRDAAAEAERGRAAEAKATEEEKQREAAAAANMASMSLFDACKEGRSDVVKAWLDSGADANSPTDAQGRTPLHVACEEGHVDVAWLLLENGAAVDRTDENGETPLYIACGNGHVAVATLLLDKGAEVDRAAKDSWTPLLIACEEGHVDIVRVLLEKGAEVDRADKYGQTPLFVACYNGHVNAARLLLEKGAEVDRATENGQTPLHIACYNGHVDAARLLLDNGAEVDRAEKCGQTPLFVACAEGHVDAARLLLEKGAEVDRASEWGGTPLAIAKSKGHSAVVALLGEFSFQKAATCTGSKPGYVFKTGAKGTGYYREEGRDEALYAKLQARHRQRMAEIAAEKEASSCGCVLS